MNLYFLVDESVAVRATRRHDGPTIALIYDGVSDAAAPNLRPDQARALARRLTLAAEEVERA